MLNQPINLEAERARLGMNKEELCAALGLRTRSYNTYAKSGTAPPIVLARLKHMTKEVR